MGRLEKRRTGLRAHRSAAEFEAAIKALLLRPVESNQRIRPARGVPHVRDEGNRSASGIAGATLGRPALAARRRPGLSLLLAMTIELVSAFGPTVLSNYADATKGNDRKGGKKHKLVIDDLSERIEPAANTDTLSESALCRLHLLVPRL